MALSSKQAGAMTRRPRGPSAENRLPADCIAKLDAEGPVRGKTWRDMPTSGTSITLRALNWWLWKRGLLVLREEREQARALAAFMRDSGQATGDIERGDA